MTPSPRTADRAALIVLMLGACVIGLGPVLVRLSDAGPVATGFWRLTTALPILIALAWADARRAPEPAPRGPSRAMLVAGVMFAVDLGCWHYGIHLTSVTNATVLSNLTPIVVAGVGWVFLHERPSRSFALALVLAVGGAVMLGLAKGGGGRGSNPPLGDALSVLTAVFYSGYFLAARAARLQARTPAVMLWSALAGLPLLLLGALLLRERLWPSVAIGWAAVCGLGLMHVTGQGAIAWALGRLPTSLIAVVVLVQPVVAAACGWLAFGERVTPLQALGGAIVLAGVVLAQRTNAGPTPAPETP